MSMEQIIKNSKKRILHLPINGYGLPSPEQTDKIMQQISQDPLCELIAFDKSVGPWDQDLEYLSWAEQLNPNRPFFIITSNYYYRENKHKQIVYYPHWFFTLLDDKNLKKYSAQDIVDFRPYKICCLNRNPWLHRCLNFLAMRRQPWFDQCQYSFGVWDRKDFDTSPTMTEQDLAFLRSINPTRLGIKDDPSFYVSNHSSAHELCSIDYVTESRVDNLFVSEKSWKPLFSGQLFFILGPKGLIKHLRDLGVETFDDVIDHGYDQETDLETKIQMLMKSISNTIENIDSIWKHTQTGRLKNLELVFDRDFHDRLVEDVIKITS